MARCNDQQPVIIWFKILLQKIVFIRALSAFCEPWQRGNDGNSQHFFSISRYRYVSMPIIPKIHEKSHKNSDPQLNSCVCVSPNNHNILDTLKCDMRKGGNRITVTLSARTKSEREYPYQNNKSFIVIWPASRRTI